MSKKKNKTNPRHIPLSKEDERKAFLEGATTAIRLTNFLMREKLGMDRDVVRKYNEHFSDYMTQIVKKEISDKDIDDVLREEYNMILRIT